MKRALACVLLLAACGDEPAAQKPAASEVEPAPVPEATDPMAAASDAATGASIRAAMPRFVGRWAALPALCESGWWRFWTDEVLTASDMRCQILPPDAHSGDTRLRLRCLAEGINTVENWQIEYPTPSTMVVIRGSQSRQHLGRC